MQILSSFPVKRSRHLTSVLLLISLLILVAGLVFFQVVSPPAWTQSGPNPSQDLTVTVTMRTDSSGTGTVTNNSATYHYRGSLTCTTTCPGPEPSGCSTTDTLTSTKQLAPGQSGNCLMFSTTDPCCQDDGHFFLSAIFTAYEYRTDANSSWAPLYPGAQISSLGAEQDAGSGNPGKDNTPTHQHHIRLDASCQCAWLPGCDPNTNQYAVDPPGTSGNPEMFVRLENISKRHHYKVRLRVAGYCPANNPNDPNLPYCDCPCGYCDPVGQNQPACPDNPNPFDPNDEKCQPYPREYHLASANTIPPFCIGPDPNNQPTLLYMDPDDWTITSDPNNPDPGHWPYCVVVLPPDGIVDVGLHPLNSCCDVPPVQNIVLCVEADTIQSQKHDDTWRDVNSSAYDRLYRRRCVDNPNDISTMYDITCFSPFSNPRDPNGICTNPK